MQTSLARGRSALLSHASRWVMSPRSWVPAWLEPWLEDARLPLHWDGHGTALAVLSSTTLVPAWAALDPRAALSW